MGVWRDGMRRAAGGLGAFVDLASPAVCAGCGRPDTAWCRTCARTFDAATSAPVRVGGAAGRVCGPLGATVAAGEYAGVVRRAVVAYKDEERRDLRRVLAPPLRAAVVAALTVLAPPSCPDSGPVVVVPAPSAARSRRRRGDVPLEDLGRAALSGVDVLTGREVVWAPMLRHGRRVADQVGLSRAERRANLDGAVELRAGVRGLRGRAVVLLDDVVTTGATAGACAAALRAAGADPVCLVVLAATASDACNPSAEPRRSLPIHPRVDYRSW